MNYHTGSDESGHKPTKSAARMTQKNAITFTYQTALRKAEFLVIELAMQEISGNKLWEYHRKPITCAPLSATLEDTSPDVTTGETKINIIVADNGNPAYSLGVGHQSRVPAKEKWDSDIIAFLHQLQIKVRKLETNGLQIRSDHKRHGQIFRGHPNYRKGGSWKDWVVVEWAGSDDHIQRLPAQIWCFIVLHHLPKTPRKLQKHKQRLNHGECNLRNGVYAVVESTQYTPNPRSNLLFRKVNLITNGERRKFYLVDTEAFVEPCFVIPDHGSPNKRAFFQIKNRDQWSRTFEDFLEEDLPEEYIADKEGRNL